MVAMLETKRHIYVSACKGFLSNLNLNQNTRGRKNAMLRSELAFGTIRFRQYVSILGTT